MQIKQIFTRALALLAIAAMPLVASGQLVTVSEDAFDDGVTTTNTTGIGNTTWTVFDSTTDAGAGTDSTITEAGGSSTHNSGSNDWGRVEYHDNTEYAAPQNTTDTQLQFNWTVGNVNVIADTAGDDYRVQLNVNDDGHVQGTGAERWLNTTGAISLDLFFDGATFQAQTWEKNASGVTPHLSAENGSPGAGGNPIAVGDTSWAFAGGQETFTLTLNDTGYTWSSSLAGFADASVDWAASSFQNGEFDTGVWAGTSFQNNGDGRGEAVLSNYSVAIEAAATVPEPASALLLCGSLGMFVMRRRRS